jgi:hypothetical protein
MTRRNKDQEKRIRVAKSFAPTDLQRTIVETAAAMGYRQRYIAAVIPGGPISVDTLQRHFREELRRGAETPIPLTDEQKLLKRVLSGKGSRRTVAARIRWLQQYGSWEK